MGERSAVVSWCPPPGHSDKHRRPHALSEGRMVGTIMLTPLLHLTRPSTFLQRIQAVGWVGAEREPIVFRLLPLSASGKLKDCRIRLLFPYDDFPVFPGTELCLSGQSFRGVPKSDGLSPILRPGGMGFQRKDLGNQRVFTSMQKRAEPCRVGERSAVVFWCPPPGHSDKRRRPHALYERRTLPKA